LILLMLLLATVHATKATAQVRENTLGIVTLTVQVTGLKSDKGRVYVALYDSSDQWLKKPVRRENVDIVDGKATKVFKDMPVGDYAISSYHDENLNQELDAGLFGIPTEPWACSRGAKGKLGPPKWKDARFKLSAESSELTIKY